MTKPLTTPKKKNPLVKSEIAQVLPAIRSRAALAMSCHASLGNFVLQVCDDCHSSTYPPRDRCPKCWGELKWKPQKRIGVLLADTTIRSTNNLYFQQHIPWRIGTILLDEGPTAFAHLHGDIKIGDEIVMNIMLDRSGAPALFALPRKASLHMEDDYQYRQFTASPKNRRVLISDGRNKIGQALAKELINAGAETIYLGNSDMNLFFDGKESLSQNPKIKIIPLNLLNTESVTKTAKQYGGKIDLIINTAYHVRPGSVAFSGKITELQNSLDINVNALSRLAKAFCPTLSSRSGDKERPAVAFVDLVSVFSLTGHPSYASMSASSAARLSLINSLRTEMKTTGLKVYSILFGPIDDEWHQEILPPKISHKQLASTVIESLKKGQEISTVGNVAKDILLRWQLDPLLAIKEMSP